ncbi:hypothetical protein J5N97_009134 [Dioscorea zingiberensis]|uniref:RING-type E3 ubiquitin transferase n=1 Tax=Dioscorea zingiberensis TaxID=325984 RepID=A0A9D5CXQ8_9LILI|nr:hypothetical protein J5N97_009134 [Dioscorea zingiberensis]
MSSGGTHWCHRCRQTIRPRERNMICPNCDGGFIEELNEMDGVGSPFDLFRMHMDGFREQHPFGIMEALSSIVRQGMGGRNREVDVRGRTNGFPDHRTGFGPGPWLIFQGNAPSRIGENGGLDFLFNGSHGVGMRRADVADYFLGPGLDELIEQLSRNDRHGPPPASSIIVALFAALSWVLQAQVATCAQDQLILRMAVEAAVALEIIPLEQKVVVIGMGDGTHSHFFGPSAHPILMLILTNMSLEGAILLLFMTILIIRWPILDGPLIKKIITEALYCPMVVLPVIMVHFSLFLVQICALCLVAFLRVYVLAGGVRNRLPETLA